MIFFFSHALIHMLIDGFIESDAVRDYFTHTNGERDTEMLIELADKFWEIQENRIVSSPTLTPTTAVTIQYLR